MKKCIVLTILIVCPIIIYSQPNNDPPSQCSGLSTKTVEIQYMVTLEGGYNYLFDADLSYCQNCNTDSIYACIFPQLD
jgi:hypothetical protein